MPATVARAVFVLWSSLALKALIEVVLISKGLKYVVKQSFLIAKKKKNVFNLF